MWKNYRIVFTLLEYSYLWSNHLYLFFQNSGVQPRHGDWSTEDAVRFQQLTEGKKFASYIRSIQADEFNPNDDIVELELIDVSTSEDIMVYQQLVDEGRAVLTSK